MDLTKNLSSRVVSVACSHIGREFCYESYNCVHFVRDVYAEVGIVLPLLKRYWPPPKEFHLNSIEFERMPLGHSVFFKRKKSKFVERSWTHVAIIIGESELIHCTRNMGMGVVITSRATFLGAYDLAKYV